MQTIKQPLHKWRDSDSEASSAQTESLDEDSDFDLAPNEPTSTPAPLLLRPRQSKPVAPRVPQVPQAPDSPEEFGLGIEGLSLDRVRNENVVFGAIEPPTRRVRPAASMMLRSEAQDPQATLKLRTAKSMWQMNQSAHETVCHRPLTVYAEPRARHKSSKPSRRKMQLIKPEPATNQAPKTVNGMVFNPATGEWEGNDASTRVFDTVRPSTSRRNMLVNLEPSSETGSMVFDSTNLCWVSRSAEPMDDPFAGINDLDDDTDSASTASTPQLGHSRGHSREHSLGRSTMSTASRREAASALSTFQVPSGVQRLWLENDQRFVRKFGAWVDGSQDIRDVAHDLYKMVN